MLLWQNFFVNVMESQLNSQASWNTWGPLFDKLNLAFTLIFTAELLVNMYANWFREFVSSGSEQSSRGQHRENPCLRIFFPPQQMLSLCSSALFFDHIAHIKSFAVFQYFSR